MIEVKDEARRARLANEDSTMRFPDRSEARRISGFLTELRELTSSFRQPLPGSRILMTIRVFYLVGSASPWRLVELLDSRYGRTRRILCFDTLEEIRAAIGERLAWQSADEGFVGRHMSVLETAVTADWVPTKDFDLVFGADRQQIRRALCTTAPTAMLTAGIIQG